MPTYHYWCPGCNNEKKEFRYMADRHQSCDCGYEFSIVPQRVRVISDIDWQDGRCGDPIDMGAALGGQQWVGSRRAHKDALKRAREKYVEETGIDLGEYHVVEDHKGRDTPMSAFDSSTPYVGKDNETVEEFERRVGGR